MTSVLKGRTKICRASSKHWKLKMENVSSSVVEATLPYNIFILYGDIRASVFPKKLCSEKALKWLHSCNEAEKISVLHLRQFNSLKLVTRVYKVPFLFTFKNTCPSEDDS